MTDLIKRPDEFYVGFKGQNPNDSALPLAFLTPYDTTAAFKKRKETVDYWALPTGTWDVATRTHIPGKQIPAKNIINEPLAGYSIAKSVKRTGSWNGGNVVWRIEDPRGFEWEIPSANLAQIISQTGISAGGIINGRCIIGRIGANNILIPEGTNLWNQMDADMDTRAKKASAKIVKGYSPGQWVTLKTGDSGWYLGYEKVKLCPRYSSNPGPHGPSNHAYHLFVTRSSHGSYHVSAYKTLPVIAFDVNRTLSVTAEADMRMGDKCLFNFAGKPEHDNAYITSFI